MSGKSVCRKLLVDECARIAGSRGTPFRVEYPCTDDIPALATCCDGMVMLNRIGNVMSQPSKVGEYTDAGFPVFVVDTPEPDANEEEATFLALYDITESSPKIKKQYGTWSQMYTAIKRELDKMFKRPGTRIVVLGFDKKQYVDGVKRITHHKRSTQRANDRTNQILKDTAAGVTPTRGLPFTFESINDHALVPYPWNETLHGKGQCAALIRHFVCKMLRFYNPPSEGQVLIIDGHNLQVSDGVCSLSQEELDCTPVVIEGMRNYHVEPLLRNSIGEFDHTAFFYVRKLAIDTDVHATFRIEPEVAQAANVHIRTNDTDTLMMGLVFLERLSQLNPAVRDLTVVMEIPKKFPAKTDTAVNVRRVLHLLSEEHGSVLQYPGAYFAYGLYLKENDYDMPFMSGIGHTTFMSALVNYPYAIGDLVKPATEPRPTEPPPPTPIQLDLSSSSDDEPETSQWTTKRKREDEDTSEPAAKRVRVEEAEDEPTGYEPPTTSGQSAQPSSRFDLAFHVREDSTTRFVAACYYEALNYRTKDQRARRELLRTEGKLDRMDPGLLSHELIAAARKRRKMSGITPQDLREKLGRHNYYAAITEDLILGFERSIPFTRAVEFGYERESYRAKLD